MSVFGAYLLGFLLYVLSVLMMYSSKVKESSWYIPISMVMSLSGTFLWTWVVKHTNDPNTLYVRGLIWDSILLGCYSFIPFLLGVKFTGTALLGIALILLGFGVLKLGSV